MGDLSLPRAPEVELGQQAGNKGEPLSLLCNI